MAMEQAVREVVYRHEALRSVFSADGKQICVLSELPANVSYIDISAKAAFGKKGLVDHLLKQDSWHVFDLLHGPLFRVSLIKLSDQECQLTLTTHRIICDDQSINTIAQDLKKLYATYNQGNYPGLPELPLGCVENVPISNEQPTESTIARQDSDGWNYPRNRPLHQLIAQTAARCLDKTALLFQHRPVSYQYLNETANQLARYIRQRGIRTGDIVGVALDRSPNMLITLLAVMKAGAAYLPLDPDYPQERIAFMLTDSSAKLLLTSNLYAETLTNSVPTVFIEDALIQSDSQSKEELAIAVSGSDLVYVLYTSGSTGKPKGVLIEHHSLVNLLWSMATAPGIRETDVLLAITTVSFDIAGLELYLPLMAGATLVIADAETAKDGRALLNLVEHDKVSMMQATPSGWRMMLDAGWGKRLPLKALCGGEPLSKDLAEKLIARCAELWNMYGPTETTIWSTVKKMSRGDAVTIGRPIANTQVYVLDESLRPVANGSVGEIYISGDGVARGYLNRPALTGERFLKNPFLNEPNQKMYRTGDLGRITEDGEIHCLGRADEQVKIRGHRIELGEIEYHLAQQRSIKETVVVANEDSFGNQQLVAFVVPRPTKQPFLTYTSGITSHAAPKADKPLMASSVMEVLPVSTEQTKLWQQNLGKQLPGYMVPAVFVALPNLPLTPNGKIDRKALPKPEQNNPPKNTAFVEPRSAEEKLLAVIWMDVLKLERISISDNFFELGGHSLLAIKVIHQLTNKTGKKLPLTSLFEYPTIRELALLLQTNEKSASWKSLVPMKPSGTKTAAYFIHGDGLTVLNFSSLLTNVEPQQPVYGLQAVGIDGTDEPLDSIEAMAAFYNSEIVAHNPNGPYVLIGHCSGGYTAVEMARQLKASGKEVKMLAVIDTPLYVSDMFWQEETQKGRTKRLAEMGWVINSFIKAPSKTLAFWYPHVQLLIKYKLMTVVAKETTPDTVVVPMDRAKEKYSVASEKYKIKPYDGTIHLFKARVCPHHVTETNFLGWEKYAPEVKVYEVPGNHATMLLAPNSRTFVKVLQDVLDNC